MTNPETPSPKDNVTAALRLVVEYDDLLRTFTGPVESITRAENDKIDAAYDAMVAACREATATTVTDTHNCPICAEPFKPDDICATDITEGPCHAACLEGSPVVDLETGEETGGKVDTYRYSEVMEPAPRDNVVAAEFDPDPPTRAYVDILKAEIAELRAGIKRLSDEEELQAETTGGDAFDLVALAAKLAITEADRADQWRLRRDAEGSRDAACAAADSLRMERDQLRKVVGELKFALFSSDMTIKDRADQSARLALSATTEGSDRG